MYVSIVHGGKHISNIGRKPATYYQRHPDLVSNLHLLFHGVGLDLQYRMTATKETPAKQEVKGCSITDDWSLQRLTESNIKHSAFDPPQSLWYGVECLKLLPPTSGLQLLFQLLVGV